MKNKHVLSFNRSTNKEEYKQYESKYAKQYTKSFIVNRKYTIPVGCEIFGKDDSGNEIFTRNIRKLKTYDKPNRKPTELNRKNYGRIYASKQNQNSI
jgi:hypothetical protein